MERQKNKRINLSFLIVSIFIGYTLATGVFVTKAGADSGLVHRADVFIAQKDWEQAVSLLKTVVQRDPNDLQSRMRLVDLYMLLDRREQAMTQVEQARVMFPQRVEPILMEAQTVLGPLVSGGDVAHEENRIVQLSSLAYEAAGIDETHPGTLYIKGMLARMQADHFVAEDYFLRALYQNSNHLNTQQALIDLYTDTGQVKLAIPLVSQALELSPRNVDTYFLVGKVFLQKDDPSKALSYLLKSRDLDVRERPRRLYYIAETQRQLGQSKEAAQSYQLLLTHWPHRSDLWVKYAMLLEGMYDMDGSIAAYRRAYALQPSVLNPLLGQAEFAFWTKSPSESLAHYRKIYQIAPERDDLLTLMTSIHYRMWQEGLSPSGMALDELEKWIRNRERQRSDISLQLAEIQIQVMRARGWTPGLRQVAQELLDHMDSPELKAQTYILLNEPELARQLADELSRPDDPSLTVQRYALLGTWPWAEQQINEGPEATSLRMWFQDWKEREVRRHNEQLAAALQFVRANMPDEALKALDKAKVFHPLSAEIQVQQANVYLMQEQLEECKKSLEVAAQLGIPPAYEAQVAELRKKLETAYLQHARKNKQSELE